MDIGAVCREFLLPGKKNLTLIYILCTCGVLIPILILISIVFAIAYKDNSDIFYRSHYIVASRTFIGAAIGYLCLVLSLGTLTLPIFVWYVIRAILALQHLRDNKIYPNPETFWIK